MVTEVERARSPVLEANSISKSFGATKALSDVDFILWPGERVAIMGENGAGKSTLMKIFAGVYGPDSGSMTLEGSSYAPASPTAAIATGVATVYQEPSAFGHLTVLENLFMGRHETLRFGVLDRRGMQRSARSLLQTLGIPTKLLDREMRTLSLAEQQMVLISRAVSRDAKILILDEPTSILTNAEASRLFELVDRLSASGTAICYITHRFDELDRVADRFVVLRDGKNAGEIDRPDKNAILDMMGSRSVTETAEARVAEAAEMNAARTAAPLLVVDGLSSGNRFHDISLTVGEGQIVGLYGLVGAGRTEVALSLFGELPIDSGRITFKGKEFHPQSSRHALGEGIAYLPEDRKTQGIFQFMTVGENISAAILRSLSRGGVLSRVRERSVVGDAMKALSVKATGPRAPISSLSGGNQQKVLFARLLATKPLLLVLDEPTRGIDVRTKQEIHENIRELARSGVAVLLISSELPEIMALAERIHVLHEGRMARTLDQADITEAQILHAAVGGEEQ